MLFCMRLCDQVHARFQCYVCEWRLLYYLASFHAYASPCVFIWCFHFLSSVVVLCYIFNYWSILFWCYVSLSLFLFSIQAYSAILFTHSSIPHQLSLQQLYFLQSSLQILILLTNNTLILQYLLPILPLIPVQPTTKITFICPHSGLFFL